MSHLKFRFGLAYQILLIGGGGVFGILLVAGIYFVGESSLARFQKQADQAAAIGALTKDTEIKLLNTRRAEKDFLLRYDEKQIKRHGDLAQSIRDNLNGLKQQLADAGRVDLVP
jgi:methyl-accepting chemotaxis protein